VQKDAPFWQRRSDPSHHVLGYRGLTDSDAELQLAVDTRRSPERVSAVHLPDQITIFAIY
jgi:hypothetical protein